ncbi:MAG: hypothetical protein ACOCP8_00555 [archaeon]
MTLSQKAFLCCGTALIILSFIPPSSPNDKTFLIGGLIYILIGFPCRKENKE